MLENLNWESIRAVLGKKKTNQNKTPNKLYRLFKWSKNPHAWEQIDPTHANPLSKPVQDAENL